MKKPTAEDLEKSAWAAALAPRHKADEVPEGWLTAREVAAKIGKNHNTASTYLLRAVSEGRCEVQRFRIEAGQRGVYPVPHYRLLK